MCVVSGFPNFWKEICHTPHTFRLLDYSIDLQDRCTRLLGYKNLFVWIKALTWYHLNLYSTLCLSTIESLVSPYSAPPVSPFLQCYPQKVRSDSSDIRPTDWPIWDSACITDQLLGGVWWADCPFTVSLLFIFIISSKPDMIWMSYHPLNS